MYSNMSKFKCKEPIFMANPVKLVQGRKNFFENLHNIYLSKFIDGKLFQILIAKNTNVKMYFGMKSYGVAWK